MKGILDRSVHIPAMMAGVIKQTHHDVSRLGLPDQGHVAEIKPELAVEELELPNLRQDRVGSHPCDHRGSGESRWLMPNLSSRQGAYSQSCSPRQLESQCRHHVHL